MRTAPLTPEKAGKHKLQMYNVKKHGGGDEGESFKELVPMTTSHTHLFPSQSPGPLTPSLDLHHSVLILRPRPSAPHQASTALATQPR